MTMEKNGGPEASISGEKELKDRASRVADEASRTVEHQASDLMEQASEMLSQAARAVRHVGDELRTEQPQMAGIAESTATRLDDACSYLRQHEAGDVLSAAQDAARRQPALAIGGGLLLGFALARILRSSEPLSSDRDHGWHGARDGGRGFGYGGSGYTGSDYGSRYGGDYSSRRGSGSSYGGGRGLGADTGDGSAAGYGSRTGDDTSAGYASTAGYGTGGTVVDAVVTEKEATEDARGTAGG